MKIYISYRRFDAEGYAGRFYDMLVGHFGISSVFMDIDSIPLSSDFVSEIQREIKQYDVFLALIGPRWHSDIDEDGNRRIDNPNDFVRIELETAINNGLRIVPILIQDAEMPHPNDLPSSLEKLFHFNAVIIRHDRFMSDVSKLIEAIESVEEKSLDEIQVIEDDPFSVFVSHSTKDRKWVEKEIIKLLTDNNIKPWYSRSSIETSTQWEREILSGMESCDWFLIVISPKAEKSEWVKDELNWALHHRPNRIIPVMKAESNLWEFHIRLPRIQHIDFTREIRKSKAALIQKLKNP